LPDPWRHLTRPTALPPCPSWCDHDHSDEFGPRPIPADTAADGGPIWGFAHSRHVRIGSLEVVLWQYVAILGDGTVVDGESAWISRGARVRVRRRRRRRTLRLHCSPRAAGDPGGGAGVVDAG